MADISAFPLAEREGYVALSLREGNSRESFIDLFPFAFTTTKTYASWVSFGIARFNLRFQSMIIADVSAFPLAEREGYVTTSLREASKTDVESLVSILIAAHHFSFGLLLAERDGYFLWLVGWPPSAVEFEECGLSLDQS